MLTGGRNPDTDAGNGALMRLAPVPVYWHLKFGDCNADGQEASTDSTQCFRSYGLMCAADLRHVACNQWLGQGSNF